MWLRKLTVSVGSSLWFVPVMCVVAGGAISFGTLALDRAFDYEAIPEGLVGHPTSATAILNTIAASMVSLAALVLTITMVVVQLAMGQFSPRIVQRILRDKPSQLAIGLFVATFVHAVLTSREVVDRGDGTGQVPGIAVVTSYVLVLASIAVLVMRRFMARPSRVFLIVAPILGLLSLGGPLTFPEASLGTKLSLSLMHVVVTIAIVRGIGIGARNPEA